MTSPGGQFISYAGKKQPPDQKGRRADLRVKDQHGRLVHLVWDKSCNGCVGHTMYFDAPFIPDVKWMTIHAEQGFPTSIEWEYQAMLEDKRAAWAMYFENLLRFAGKMPGVSATTAYEAALNRQWDDVPKALLKECGITPQPEEMIKAAMAGNKWVLGFSTIVPEWAGPLVRLMELNKSKIGGAITDADLDMYRDEEEPLAALDDQFDPDAKGGKREPVRQEKTENTRHTKTRREVRLSGSLEE